MPKESESRTAFWLSGATVETAAAGLRLAVREGVLPVADYARSVSGCTLCGDPVACRAAVAGGADAACRNARLIGELTTPG